MFGEFSAQSYTSYFTGDTVNISTSPEGGICMMGGATEHDEAMKWFLERAKGGDILVLRASGSDGYNNYLYSQLGVSVNSVETIIFHQVSANSEPYIHQQIQQAEAIWLAGGNQWDYISFWRNSAIDSLINDAIINRNIVIGGTSAGMAILGKYYFSAQTGTVTSSTALSNPYHTSVNVDSTKFLNLVMLRDVITDTHYDNPDRRGRHITFLGRVLQDWNIKAKGIACEEYTAVCIDTNGIARVFGEYPNYDDAAYFIQPNCELSSLYPENCSSGNPLTWNLNNLAVKTYKVYGTNQGTGYFNIINWQTGNGGQWYDWYVDNGIFYSNPGDSINCGNTAISESSVDSAIFKLYPNPSNVNCVNIVFDQEGSKTISILDNKGQRISKTILSNPTLSYRVNDLETGVYFIQVISANKISTKKLIISN